MRVIFAGSPAIAIPSLETLTRIKEIELTGVLTNPDTPKGRNKTLTPTEVGEAAKGLGMNIPILKPEKLDQAAREQITALAPDLLVSFAYGHIFGPKFLSLFPLGGINIHPSLLPIYRGPAPIQTAILNRDPVTGITIQKIALEIDCGDIITQEQIPLAGTETTGSLSETVSIKAAEMLTRALARIAAGEQGIPQDHEKASSCRLISRDDALIDWTLSAAEIEAKIRAFTPWPLCRTIHNGKELFIIKAGVYSDTIRQEHLAAGRVLGTDKQYGILVGTGAGVLCVTELQYQQKKALFWKDFINGARFFEGSILGISIL